MTNQQILVACSAGLMMCCAARLAHGRERVGCAARTATMAVRLHNNAGVPHDVLTSAKDYTRETYKRIGVALKWLDPRDAVDDNVGLPYTVVLTSQVTQREGTEDNIGDNVVGQAVAGARRAYVHYERVVGLAQPPARDIVSFLGYVMAHELGHLILPGRGHSAAGVMRAGSPLAFRSIETFTAIDAAAICTRLEHETKMRLSIGRPRAFDPEAEPAR